MKISKTEKTVYMKKSFPLYEHLYITWNEEIFDVNLLFDNIWNSVPRFGSNYCNLTSTFHHSMNKLFDIGPGPNCLWATSENFLFLFRFGLDIWVTSVVGKCPFDISFFTGYLALYKSSFQHQVWNFKQNMGHQF